MNEPIPIKKTEPELLSMEDRKSLDNARMARIISITVLIFGGVVTVALITPLVLWLSRLALGG